MPPVFIAIAELLFAVGEVIGVPAALAIFNSILFIGASIVLGEVSKMFTKSASQALSNNNRTVTSRQGFEE